MPQTLCSRRSLRRGGNYAFHFFFSLLRLAPCVSIKYILVSFFEKKGNFLDSTSRTVLSFAFPSRPLLKKELFALAVSGSSPPTYSPFFFLYFYLASSSIKLEKCLSVNHQWLPCCSFQWPFLGPGWIRSIPSSGGWNTSGHSPRKNYWRVWHPPLLSHLPRILCAFLLLQQFPKCRSFSGPTNRLLSSFLQHSFPR